VVDTDSYPCALPWDSPELLFSKRPFPTLRLCRFLSGLFRAPPSLPGAWPAWVAPSDDTRAQDSLVGVLRWQRCLGWAQAVRLARPWARGVSAAPAALRLREGEVAVDASPTPRLSALELSHSARH